MSILYVAGVSISDNPKDISPVTLNKIKEAKVVIGEERKNTLRLLKIAEADDNKEIYFINEHSKDSDRNEVLKAVLSSDISVFFSDCGTPCISDPDYNFIRMCRQKGVIIKSLAGASSITTAISVAGINASKFLFAGFPPKKDVDRKKFFKEVLSSKVAVVFMERPYSLENTLKDISCCDRKISLSINLGMDNELNLYDKPLSLIDKVKGIKAPFIIVIPALQKKLNSNKYCSK